MDFEKIISEKEGIKNTYYVIKVRDTRFKTAEITDTIHISIEVAKDLQEVLSRIIKQ